MPEIARISNKNKWRWAMLTLLSLLILAALGYFAVPLLSGPKIRVFQVQGAELIQTVVASGRVETPARVDIGTQLLGRVLNVPVKEGQSVQAGALLIELDAADDSAALAQATAAVHQAELKLRQLQDLTRPVLEQSQRQAQVNLFNLQKQFERSRALLAQGFLGQAQLDEVQRNLELARSQLASVQLQLHALLPGGSAYRLASSALEQARAGQRAAQARLAHSKITAVADGVLIARDVERGDIVQPGKVLMVLSPSGLTQLLVQIDEKNLRFLQIGQTAQAVADAYPGQKFGAQVAFINPGINAQRGSVDVKLNVADAPAFLRQDMTVSVEIEVARRKDALSLNLEAIRDAAGHAPWVLLVQDGKAVRRTVKLGMQGDKRIEILSGLKQADLVLPATGIAVTEGGRMRAEVRPENRQGEGRR